MSDRARRRGRPIQIADAWIAATVLALGVPPVTNNHAADGLLLPRQSTPMPCLVKFRGRIFTKANPE